MEFMTLKTVDFQNKKTLDFRNFVLFIVFRIPSLVNYRSNMTLLVSKRAVKKLSVTKQKFGKNSL